MTEISTINQLTCGLVFFFFFFTEYQQQSLGCGVNTSVLSEPPRLAPAPAKGRGGAGGHGRGRRSEPDLPPGVAHAGTVGPAAGRRRGERARGAVRAHQPQAALRGRRGDVTVHGHSSGREGALACLGREHEWLLVRLLGQSLRTLGHWHLSKDTRHVPV